MVGRKDRTDTSQFSLIRDSLEVSRNTNRFIPSLCESRATRPEPALDKLRKPPDWVGCGCDPVVFPPSSGWEPAWAMQKERDKKVLTSWTCVAPVLTRNLTQNTGSLEENV